MRWKHFYVTSNHNTLAYIYTLVLFTRSYFLYHCWIWTWKIKADIISLLSFNIISGSYSMCDSLNLVLYLDASPSFQFWGRPAIVRFPSHTATNDCLVMFQIMHIVSLLNHRRVKKGKGGKISLTNLSPSLQEVRKSEGRLLPYFNNVISEKGDSL